MFDWKNFPWTDFQDLNLDWILRKIKELKTVDLPALDDKIDNVYNYIKEQLPEIVSELASVIINVKWTGAVGDGVTDDSDAVREALKMSNIIYFPEGSYSLAEIDVYQPIVILGDGNTSVLIPQRKHAQTNQFKRIFTFYERAVVKGIKLWADNSVTPESGAMTYNTSAFYANGVKSVVFEDVTIEHIYERYRKSVADVNIDEREAMAITCYNCDLVVFHNCDLSDWGGEELINIAQSRARYGSGVTVFDSCIIHDRPAFLEKGSAFGTMGGTAYFTNNVVQNVNYTYLQNNEEVGGSIVNINGCYSFVDNNKFENCTCGNYFDISEGAYTKTEYAIVSNNICNGSQKNGIHFNARNAYIINNYIRGCQCISSTTQTDNSTQSLAFGGIYCENPNTAWLYENLVIDGNEFVTIGNPFSNPPTDTYYTVLTMCRPVTGQDPIQARVVIKNNIFGRAADAFVSNTIYFAGRVSRCLIKNNVFKDTGLSNPIFATYPNSKAFISGNSAVYYLEAIDNILDLSYDPDDPYILITGTKIFRDNSYYYVYKNVAIKSHATATPSGMYIHTGNEPTCYFDANINIDGEKPT